jgi:hypothetical protein
MNFAKHIHDECGEDTLWTGLGATVRCAFPFFFFSPSPACGSGVLFLIAMRSNSDAEIFGNGTHGTNGTDGCGDPDVASDSTVCSTGVSIAYDDSYDNFTFYEISWSRAIKTLFWQDLSR